MPEVAGLVKVDPPPLEVLPFRYNPEQFLRQMGTAIWQERQVDRGKSVLEYRGVSAHRISLDLFYDAIRPGFGSSPAPTHYIAGGTHPRDVERELATLHRLALPWVQGDPTAEPPKIQVRYGHGQQIRWVIADLVWNSEVRNTLGRRAQASVTVELLEYNSARPALSPVEAAQTGVYTRPTDPVPDGLPGPATRPGATRTYTVRAGDTLSGIAARELGSAGRFMEVYTLNSPPLTSPDLITVGQVLTLPAA